MPIKKSAAKALRQARRRTRSNRAVKDNIAFLRRMLRKAVEAKDLKKATEYAKQVIKAVDKAAQNKVLKRNTAGRIKSRLAKRLNDLRKK